MVLVQNLLDMLVYLNPAVPTYIGLPLRNWEYTHSYMQGGFYGFPWGVAKTIAEAEMSDYDVTFNRPEDARMGILMVRLQSVSRREREPNSGLPDYPDRNGKLIHQ